MEREKPRLTPVQRVRVLVGYLEDECREALGKLDRHRADVVVGLLKQAERMRDRVLSIGGSLEEHSGD